MGTWLQKKKKPELYLPFMKSKAVANQEHNVKDLKCKKNGITRKMAMGIL